MEKILIVDDDKNICDTLKTNLEKEGYSTIVTASGEEAISKFDSFRPDFVLLDVMLPDIDGWQVCREIRKKHNTPIVFVTAK